MKTISMKTISIVAAFIVGFAVALLFRPYTSPGLLAILTLFPIVLIVLILLFGSPKRIVIPSEFSKPLQEFDSPVKQYRLAPEPHRAGSYNIPTTSRNAGQGAQRKHSGSVDLTVGSEAEAKRKRRK